MHLIFDPDTQCCTGYMEGSTAGFAGGTLVAVSALPDDLHDLILLADGTVERDAAKSLARAKTTSIATIKSKAAALIAATDWKLQRAQEREAAGWATLAQVDTVLAEREAIRRSSDAAEQAILAATSVAEVQAVQWSGEDVAVPPPQRVTRAAFLDALRAQGEGVIPSILQAKDGNPALLQWWTYFEQSEYIACGDTRLNFGLQGLEMAGLLPQGGADAVLAQMQTGAV